MTKLAGSIVPENDREEELMEDLFEVTGDARQDGVSTIDITLMMRGVAMLIAEHDHHGQPETPLPESSEGSDAVCPECDEPIDDAIFQMGGVAEARPCGCTVDTDDLPEAISDG